MRAAPAVEISTTQLHGVAPFSSTSQHYFFMTTSYPKPNTSNGSSINQSEAPLLVFVSYRASMKEEREGVDRAIRSIPITRAWLFEYTPASSQEIEDSYLSKVRECDLFVLLLGIEYSGAVAQEYRTAVETGKPILAFIQRGDRDAKQDELARSITTKSSSYTGPQDLYDLVKASVIDEVIRRFKSTLPSSDVPKLIESLPTPVRKLEEITGYSIVGMEEAEVGKILFEPFGGTLAPENLKEAYPSFEPVYFDDFSEMKGVFDAINRAHSKAAKTPADRQKAFWRALKEEAIALASHYIIQQRTKKPTSQITVPGLKYFIWGVAPDVARMMKLMRPREIRGGSTPVKRDATEYLFRDVNYFLKVFTEIHKAGQGHGGDDNEFLRLLFEGAMRLQLLKDDDDEEWYGTKA